MPLKVVGKALKAEEQDRMDTLKALIFDVDGTLADTEEVHRQAFNIAFQEAGLAQLSQLDGLTGPEGA